MSLRTIGLQGTRPTASGVKYRGAANRRCIKMQIVPRVAPTTRWNSSLAHIELVKLPGLRAVGLSPVEGGDSMTVKTILSRKGRNVVTIEPSATLEAAIATLAKHRIGAVVVLGADRRVIGILSERDIVRAFAEFGANALTKRLAQVMTREVATCEEAETAVSIMERMTTGKFRHIPVVERDQLVGIVSIGDIVKHRLWVMEQESAALREYIQSA